MQAPVIIARFLRKGGEGTYTRVFSNLETAIQKNITDHTSFGDETPLIAYLKDAYWVIITMQCLYLKDNAGGVQQLKFEDCKGLVCAGVKLPTFHISVALKI